MTMTPKIFSTLPISDLRLYYNSSYLRLRLASNKPFRWVFVNEFTSSDSSGTKDKLISCTTEKKENLRIPLQELEIDFQQPQSRVYTYKNTVVVLEKRPARQTTKGLAKSNTHITNLLAYVRKAGGIPVDFYQAHDFEFTPKGLNLLLEDSAPVEWDKGYQKILKKQMLAFAINSRISLSQGILSEFPTIWLKMRMVGELCPKKTLICPLHDAFIPELAYTFLDKGFTIQTD